MSCPAFDCARRLAFVLAACLAGGWLLAQAGAPREPWHSDVAHYDTRDGLSHNDIYAVAADERGVLWLGTANGLNRFDGLAFKHFDVYQGFYNGTIHQIFVDGPFLWLLYKDLTGLERIRHIEIFDVYSERLIPLSEYLRLPCAWAQVRSVAAISPKTLLFTEHDGTQHAYHQGRGFETLRFLEKGENPIHCDNYGQWWTYLRDETWAYIRQRDPDGHEIGQIKLPAASGYSLDLVHESENDLLFAVGRRDKIILRNLLRVGRNLHHEYLPRIANDRNNVPMSGIHYFPGLDVLWLSSLSDSPNELWDKQENLLHELPTEVLRTNATNRQSLVQGNALWLASGQGLYRVRVQRSVFRTHLNGRQPILALRALQKLGDYVYLATAYGVFRMKPGQAPEADPVLPFALALCEDGNGQLWGANNASLCRFDPSTGSKTWHNIPYNEPWVLRADPTGHIWMSQWGLCRFNPANDSCEQVQAPDFPEFAAQTVYHIYPRDGQAWWLCSTGGIYVLDVARRRIVARYWSGGEGAYYLPVDEVRHLHYDAARRAFWLATGGGELVYWPQEAGGEILRHRFEATRRAALHAVYADGNGYLWLPSDNGLVQFEKSTGAYRRYSRADGLPSDEFNRISHFQDLDGTLYFGSTDGLVLFHPRDFAAAWADADALAPLLVEAEVYASSGAFKNLGGQMRASQVLPFLPSDRFLSLRFGLSVPAQAQGLRYEYQIKNQGSRDWTPIGGNELMLGRLPYGRQVLRVRATLANGRMTGQMLEVPIYVHHPFYLTWWFFLGLLCLLIAFIWWRTQNLRRRNQALEIEVRRRTRTIEAQAAELRELDEVKSRFFVNISHELRTPLTLILAPAQHLASLDSAPPGVAERAKFIVQNGRRLMKMVNEILDLAKLEAGAIEVNERPVEVLPVLRQVAELFVPQAQHLSIGFTLQSELPADVSLRLDMEKVESIVANLLSNAFRFTPPGGQVTLAARQDVDGRLLLTISDTGRGIAPEDVPRIFDRFFQVKGEQAEGGTGLGLALSRELAQLMGGRLWAESKLGKGSHFHLRLPWKVAGQMAAAAATATAPPGDAAAQPAAPAAAPHILVVEDHPDLQAYLRQLLGVEYQVATASHGGEALDYLAKAERLPDLVLSDIMMPVIDGYKLLGLLKSDERYAHIPVIMLTARADVQDRLQALRIGVDDYLTKPFDEGELRLRIRKLLEHAGGRQDDAASSADGAEGTAARQAWLGQLEEEARLSLAQQNLSVERLAQRLGCGRHTLNRQVKALTGLTAAQYLQELRLAHARELMEARSVGSVAEAAKMAGFTDARYFSRQFKERYGRLPSELLSGE